MDFEYIREHTDGMLPLAVYEAIYRCARTAPTGNLVEVGAAHGAATIAMASGVKDCGRRAQVYTFETGEAMKSPAFQHSNRANLKILADNLRRFDVSDVVRVIPHHVKDAAEDWAAICDQPISLLFLDADGVLDRDFVLFYNAMSPGASIIIDDYQNKIDLDGQGYNPLGKYQATYRYVNYFLKKGLLARASVIGNTFFGNKPEAITEPVQFNHEELRTVRDQMSQEKSRLAAAITAARSELADNLELLPAEDAPTQGLRHIPSMISSRVLAHLYECCRRHRGIGEVVEVGSWLGASASHMAAGLRDAEAKALFHCYDAWKATEKEVRRAAGQDGFVSPLEIPIKLVVGQDLSAIFLNHVIPVYPRVKATRTEIRKITWCGRPIELLHDDASKFDADFRHVMKTFGPSFVPGVTLLVLSDFNYWKVPHCPEEKREEMKAQTNIMGGLSDYFTLVFDSGIDCAVTFLYTNEFSFDEL